MTKAVVFDLDGTLADSIHCIVTAMKRVATQMQLVDASTQSIRHLIGQPLNVMFPTLYQTTPTQTQEAIDRYRIEYVHLTQTEEQLFEGVLELLTQLRNHNVKLAIATGKNQAGAEHACERLGLNPFFDSIHGILPGTPGKPDPAVLRRAMTALNVSHRECVMVGDTTYDMALAQAVQVRGIGVSWGVHSRTELSTQTTQVADSMIELTEILLG